MANPMKEQAAKRYAGGWREDRSPDGRISMWQNDRTGERLSRQEFADKYPRGAGDPDFDASMMLQQTMREGPGGGTVGGTDPNLKVGVLPFGGKMSPELHEANTLLRSTREYKGMVDARPRQRGHIDRASLSDAEMSILSKRRAAAYKNAPSTQKATDAGMKHGPEPIDNYAKHRATVDRLVEQERRRLINAGLTEAEAERRAFNKVLAPDE